MHNGKVSASQSSQVTSTTGVPASWSTSSVTDVINKVTATGVRVDVRITHGQLAELVATTRETLTKVAGWLRSENIAALERRQIWIADYAALQEVAEGSRIMPGRAQRASAAAGEVEHEAPTFGAKVGDRETVHADDA